MNSTKSYQIPKQLVVEAFKKVKANQGAAGVDGESIAGFELCLKGNLYKIWNRMSAGSYMPPPIKEVPIPKKSGGVRVLGVPTVSDRVAQMVVKLHLEKIFDPLFHKDSYGYRPGKSAHDAIDVTRKRCWKYPWVVEFDIKGAFDNIDHDLLMKAVTKHCKDPWVILYVERWLKAPMKSRSGELVSRTRGTPQGGVISPLLANLFFHYAFDMWVGRTLPEVPFCRYADDGLLHCKSLRQAEFILRIVKDRMKECKLEIHPIKSKIVYCKDTHRKDEYENISFDFLGYTFRPRKSRDKIGRVWTNFGPAVSNSSLKEMRQTIRSWEIQLRSEKSLEDLSNMFNPVLRGWKAYYSRFYPSEMYKIWNHMNEYLARWLMRKSKKYRGYKTRAFDMLDKYRQKKSRLFVYWQLRAQTE